MASKDKPGHERKRQKKHSRDEELALKREKRREEQEALRNLRKRVRRTGHAPIPAAE
jgi:hypothetical protein